jgi:hypothetical protein
MVGAAFFARLATLDRHFNNVFIREFPCRKLQYLTSKADFISDAAKYQRNK